MKPRLLVLLPLCLLFLHCFSEPAPVGSSRIVGDPLAVTPTGIQLAVGNKYYWQYRRTTNLGGITLWNQTDSIVSQTSMNGNHYFVFSSGTMLRSAGDSVLALSGNSASVYYRFDVTLGQTAPFLGEMMAVTAADTASVFGETQRVCTVSSQSAGVTSLDRGRYASKFGLLEVTESGPTYVTRGILMAARINNVNYSQP